MVNHFNQWNELKQKLHVSEKKLLFKEGEIWWCSIGQNIGTEVYGKGKFFRRPVFVLKKLSNSSCLVIPLSTKGYSGSWYISVQSGSKKAWANISQIRTLSTLRFDTKIGDIRKCDFYKIKKSIADLLGFFPLSPDL